MKVIGKAAALMGHVENVVIGSNFLVVEGWVCVTDKSAAEPPLMFIVGSLQQSGFRLFKRLDLYQAGLGGGMAAFKAVTVLEAPLHQSVSTIEVEDSLGRRVQLPMSLENCRHFRPLGAIDSVDNLCVRGWLFDPKFAMAVDGVLLIDGEHLAAVIPSVQRVDIDYDLGDQQNLFGFAVRIDEAVKRHVARFSPNKPIDCRLSLASSGRILFETMITVEGGRIERVFGMKAVAVGRVACSDVLDRAMVRV